MNHVCVYVCVYIVYIYIYISMHKSLWNAQINISGTDNHVITRVIMYSDVNIN